MGRMEEAAVGPVQSEHESPALGTQSGCSWQGVPRLRDGGGGGGGARPRPAASPTPSPWPECCFLHSLASSQGRSLGTLGLSLPDKQQAKEDGGTLGTMIPAPPNPGQATPFLVRERSGRKGTLPVGTSAPAPSTGPGDGVFSAGPSELHASVDSGLSAAPSSPPQPLCPLPCLQAGQGPLLRWAEGRLCSGRTRGPSLQPCHVPPGPRVGRGEGDGSSLCRASGVLLFSGALLQMHSLT